MTVSGNEGLEGIEFVPDSYLKAIEFISSETKQKYSSTKGMGGLIFIAHQEKGRDRKDCLRWYKDFNAEGASVNNWKKV